MTVESLGSCNVKELGKMAKEQGVLGWHSMRKEQLISALAELDAASKNARPRRGSKPAPAAAKAPAKSPSAASSKPSAKAPAPTRKSNSSRRAQPEAAAPAPASKPSVRPASRRSRSTPAAPPAAVPTVVVAAPAALPVPVVVAPEVPLVESPGSILMNRVKDQLARSKNLAYRHSPDQPQGYTKDRLVMMVRDPYWLHAYWELTQLGVKRAEAALAQSWHTAKPALRLYEVQNSGVGAPTETLLRTISIHGGTNNWYVDVQEPPKSYRADIGYLARDGKFFVLAKSNVVHTPRAGTTESVDHNWTDLAENYDRVLAMNGGYSPDGPNSELRKVFEERLRRPMQTMFSRNLLAGVIPRTKAFNFKIDAELIIHGSTEPDARVTLQGDPVQLRSDGTFTVRFNLPDCRQIIPAVASSADGSEQRTIVVAVERNTKVMEPVTRDCED